MYVSIQEAAQLSGKNDRQIRYLIQQGKLPAKKEGGRWLVDRDHLPLTAAEQKKQNLQAEKALNITEQVIQKQSKPAKRRYSMQDLRAFQTGSQLLSAMLAEIP